MSPLRAGPWGGARLSVPRGRGSGSGRGHARSAAAGPCPSALHALAVKDGIFNGVCGSVCVCLKLTLSWKDVSLNMCCDIFLSLFRCGSSAAFHEGALLPKGGGFPEFLEKRDSPSGTGEKGLYQHQAAEGAIVQEIKQQN